MVNLTTLTVLGSLEEEMAQAGRTHEEQALRAARQALARSGRGFLSTGQAAERLGVTIPTVKRWIQRGVLAGGSLGKRWMVTTESVERVQHLRDALLALDA